MAKTWQTMDILVSGMRFICIFDTTKPHNPYRLYRKYYDKGWHRKKIAEYADAESVLWHILQTVNPGCPR